MSRKFEIFFKSNIGKIIYKHQLLSLHIRNILSTKHIYSWVVYPPAIQSQELCNSPDSSPQPVISVPDGWMWREIVHRTGNVDIFISIRFSLPGGIAGADPLGIFHGFWISFGDAFQLQYLMYHIIMLFN